MLPSSQDRKAIQATLRFANLRRIESGGEVERCFADLVEFRDSRWSGALTVDPTPGYVDYHAQLRDWLEKVTKSNAGRQEVAAQVAREVEESVSAKLVFAKGRLNHINEFEGLFAVCAFAVAVILDERHALTTRLQQCVCGRFHFDPNAKGRPRKFCSPKHKAQADAKTVAKRVATWRAEQAVLKKRKARKA